MATQADIAAALQQAGVTVYGLQGANGSVVGTVASEKAGDNMRKIACHVYGDEMQWKRIWEANKDRIPNPDVVRRGLELTIPA